VGIWSDQVVPRATDLLLAAGDIARVRAEALSGLGGDVVEVGFGSGLNLPYYPAQVSRVLAVEPSGVARALAGRRVGAAAVPVRYVGSDAQELALEPASVDAAVSTFTLCTIPDPRRALAELRRVLKPGGSFRFVEHGLSPNPRIARWQHRLTPIQRRVAAGCHLDRPIEALVRQAGFELASLRTEELAAPGPLRLLGHLSIGVATSPAGTPAPPAPPAGAE
jgi:SAM-dependent methyltransferase